MQGGSNREWAKPFTPKAQPGQAVGTHRGHMSFLNVVNPEPGFHYAYMHTGDAHRAGTQQMVNQGYRPVKRDGQVSIGADLPSEFGSPQDSLVGAGNLKLMQIPIEKYRELQREEDAYRERSINGPTDRLLGGNEAARSAMPGGHKLDPFYTHGDHGRNGYQSKKPGEDS